MNNGAPVKQDVHLQRLEQMPADEPLTVPQLKRLWHVTNPLPTLRYLLDNDLCKWRLTRNRKAATTYVYYRPADTAQLAPR